MSGNVQATPASLTGTALALHWSLRSTFTEYVRSIDDGAVTTDDVEIDSAGRFVFANLPIDTAGIETDTLDPDIADPSAVVAFRGAVHFWAHLGVLNFHLAEIRLHLDAEPRLTVGPQPRATGRATIALLTEVDPAPGSGPVRTFEAALTDVGVRLLGGVYSVGAPLDLLTLVSAQTTSVASPSADAG